MSTGPDRSATPSTQAHWVYTIYLVNLLWQPVFNPENDWAGWAIVAVIVLLFVPLWGGLRRARPRRRVRLLAALTVLGGLGLLVNAGAGVVLVYAAAGAAPLGRRVAMRWLVGLSLLVVALMAWSFVPLPYRAWAGVPALLFIWIIGFASRAEVEQQAEAERLRIENVRVEHLAAAGERERIARDLHDLVGQSLTGLVVRAQLVAQLASASPAEVGPAAEGLEEAARDVLEQVRGAVSGMSDASLDDEVTTARRVLRVANVHAEVDLPDDARPSPMVERTLALALREAVTNVVRHADARTCTIRVALEDGTWRLQVDDDGHGGAAAEGNGLRGMRERVAAVGGVLERRSSPGTRLRVSVPA